MTRCDAPLRRRRAARQRGFSYLWVLLLVALLGLSWAMASDVYGTATRRDQEAELIAIGRQYRLALARYHEQQVSGRREYPLSLDDLLQDKRMSGGRRHLRRVFVDPMTGKREWGLVRIGGRIVGVRSLSDKTPIKQAGFEAEEMGFAGKQKYSEWVFTHPADLLRGRDIAGELPVDAERKPGLSPNPATPSLFGPAASSPGRTSP